MSQKPYNLPGLTQLASFEAAARHLSFKEAAIELSVTASAISHQIRLLESDLSSRLFDRANRRVRMTPEGEELYATLTSAFSDIGIVADEIRAKGALSTVSIASSPSVSSLWLAPRISSFLKTHRNLRVTSELAEDAEISRSDIDLQIVYGQSEDDFTDKQEIFRDELVPVASPQFAKRYGSPSVAGLAKLPLVQVENDDTTWMNWRDWFSALGYLGNINYAFKVNSHLDALEIAQGGTGLALAGRQLIEPMLEEKKLVILSDFFVPARDAFYLVRISDDPLNDAGRLFSEWLLQPPQKALRAVAS